MKNCAYEDVHCTNPECNEVMPRRALQYHLVSKCRWRVVSCHFCAEMYTYKDSKVTSKQLRTLYGDFPGLLGQCIYNVFTRQISARPAC